MPETIEQVNKSHLRVEQAHGGRRPAHAILREAAHAGIAERTLYHGKRGSRNRECSQRLRWWALDMEGANAGRRRQTLKAYY
jgi:hypothetical protein